MLRKHIVVVGGGWAGLRLVHKLKKVNYSKVRITLISDSPNFRYSAALYRVATGFRVREAIIPISQLTSNIASLKFIKARAKTINKETQEITLDNGKIINYDYAVIALGSVTSYFGIPGLKKFSYGIKTKAELDRLRTHLHQELIEEHKPDKNYIVVGAGPTGVELSASLMSYLKKAARRHGIQHRRINIELIESDKQVLPKSIPAVSKKVHRRLRQLGVKVFLNSTVISETESSLRVNDRVIESHTVIWTAGVDNNPFFSKNKNQFVLNNRNRVIVNDHLMSYNNLYVIGDNAVTPYTGLGLTAVHNATYVANDIMKRISGKKITPAYKPLVPATVIPVGNRWAVFNYKKIIIAGWLGSLLRTTADLAAYHDIAGTVEGFKIWLKGGEKEEICTICRSALQDESRHNFLLNFTDLS